MKSKLSLIILILLVSLNLFSCRKESTPDLSGEWISTAIYTKNDAGAFEWVATQRTPQVATFYKNNNRFAFFTDVPGGVGTYNYDRPSSKLQLNFEADDYSTSAKQEVQTIEKITEEELVTVTFATSGQLAYKIKYFRKQ